MRLPTVEQALGPPNVECPICGGEGWVCEHHPANAWSDGDGCCGGAGMQCMCRSSQRETG
ncbi:hypothetical protein LCGC14_1495290 [marine sediment metagenome]|uniref:Uncharacterized protein n=1 Tax=marine sediment metagenome TaxID=412755 RepID=A0A0F9J674_9ZZZZ